MFNSFYSNPHVWSLVMSVNIINISFQSKHNLELTPFHFEEQDEDWCYCFILTGSIFIRQTCLRSRLWILILLWNSPPPPNVSLMVHPLHSWDEPSLPQWLWWWSSVSYSLLWLQVIYLTLNTKLYQVPSSARWSPSLKTTAQHSRVLWLLIGSYPMSHGLSSVIWIIFVNKWTCHFKVDTSSHL